MDTNINTVKTINFYGKTFTLPNPIELSNEELHSFKHETTAILYCLLKSVCKEEDND